MIKAVLVNPGDARVLGIHKDPRGDHCIEVMTPDKAYGQFKSLQVVKTPATYIVASPPLDGAIVLTDLLMSTDKASASDITVRFTDGTNTVVVYAAQTIDAAMNVNMPFAGRWRGWKNARIEVVITGNITVTVAVGYYKISAGDYSLSFAEWDAGR